MTQITEYTTTRASNFKDFDIAVNEHIERGFQPFGNPYMTESEGEFLACQAMVKYAGHTKEPPR